MQEALLVVHILAAAAWIGGGLLAATSFSTLARQIGVKQIGVKQVGSLDEAIGSRCFGTSVVVLVLSGIALVLNSDATAGATPSSRSVWALSSLTGPCRGPYSGPGRRKRMRLKTPAISSE